MPNLRFEPHHRICNLRYGTHGYHIFTAIYVRCRTKMTDEEIGAVLQEYAMQIAGKEL